MDSTEALSTIARIAEDRFGVSADRVTALVSVSSVRTQAVTALTAFIYLEERRWPDAPDDVTADARMLVDAAIARWFEPSDIQVNSPVYERRCLACDGKGTRCAMCHGTGEAICPKCGGGGVNIREHQHDISVQLAPSRHPMRHHEPHLRYSDMTVDPCSLCGSRGLTACYCRGASEPCTGCGGTGRIVGSRALRVRRWTERFDETSGSTSLTDEVRARLRLIHSESAERINVIGELTAARGGPYRGLLDPAVEQSARRLAEAIDTSGIDASTRVLQERFEVRCGNLDVALCETSGQLYEVTWVDRVLVEVPLWLAGIGDGQ